MTSSTDKPPHIILIESKRPCDRTPEERRIMAEYRAERAALFQEVRRKAGV